MKEIKGYTVEEIAEERKNQIDEDWRWIQAKRRERDQKEEEIGKINESIKNLLITYRIESVDRVLEYIRLAKITDEKELNTLLCHCQNKLNGHIDGTELTLERK